MNLIYLKGFKKKYMYIYDFKKTNGAANTIF